MPKGKQQPNTLKFKVVHSDKSSLEGLVHCDDDQWNEIFAILMRSPDRQAFVEQKEQNEGTKDGNG